MKYFFLFFVVLSSLYADEERILLSQIREAEQQGTAITIDPVGAIAAIGKQETSPPASTVPLASIEGTPSAIVNNCVNVITGEFCDAEVDLAIPGAEPLIIQRSYSSLVQGEGSFGRSWDINHFHELIFSSRKETYQRCCSMQGGRYQLEYAGNRKERVGDTYIFHDICRLQPRQDRLSKGFTNVGSGFIGGRTNPKNRVIEGNVAKSECCMFLEKGSTRYFRHNITPKGKSEAMFRFLDLEKKANGNTISYDYHETVCPKKMTVRNSEGTHLSEAEFSYDKLSTRMRIATLQASNGDTIKYRFNRYHSHGGKETNPLKYSSYGFFLESVTLPGGFTQNYGYREIKNNYHDEAGEKHSHHDRKISIKFEPNNRFLSINYYEGGSNRVGNDPKKYSEFKLEKGDWRIGRVKDLYAPVGTTSTPVLTHRFYYKKRNSYWHEIKCRETTVYDALDHKKVYRISLSNRLEAIQWFSDKKSVYAEEKFVWGTQSDKIGNLNAHLYEDTNGNIQFFHTYDYDDRGNVLKAELFGNLSGQNSVLAKREEVDQLEKYAVNSTYNDKNLLMSSDDGYQKTTYTYEKDTDLIAGKFIWEGDAIRKRHFYEYDPSAVVIQEIVDDGTSTDPNDLVNVTQRLITSTIPTTNGVIGLPEDVQHKYLDLMTGEEVLLKHIFNHYSTRGDLIKQDVYDCHNQYAYSLEWEYDAAGSVTLKQDALGHITRYTYDENRNLVSEEGPRPGFAKHFDYDFSNRLIREEEVDAEGTRLVTSHEYDYLGNRTATIDCYGNKTEYTYDPFGRRIQTRNPALYVDGTPKHPVNTTDYDTMSHVTATTDPLGHVTRFSHTIRGKPYETVYPDGSKEQVVYRLDGAVQHTVAQNGMVTYYTYDYQQRPIKTETRSPDGALLKVTTATYNAFHLLSETDGEGHTTHYTYDGAGRKTCITKDNEKTCFEYDALGRLHKKLNFFENDCQMHIQEHDFLDRIIEERIEDGSGRQLKKIGYAYDEQGNRTHTFTYNQAGVGVQETVYNGYRQPIKTVDAEGNITTTNYQYDYCNEHGQTVLCIETTDPLGNITQSIHDTMGNVSQMVRQNAFGETIQKNTHTYDLAGNRIRTITTVFTPESDERDVITEWSYDTQNRLIKRTEASGAPEQKITSYRYNRFGQKEAVVNPDGSQLLHEYDSLGRLVVFRSDSFHYCYCYDSNDNPVEVIDAIYQTQTVRTYDSNNRLTQEVLGNGLTLNYVYDGLGRVTTLTLPDQSIVEYRYDAAFLRMVNHRALSHKYLEHDLSGNLLKAQLVNGDPITYQYDLLGRKTKTHTPHWNEIIEEYDAVGNVLTKKVQDSEGTTCAQFTYDDLRQLKSETGTISHQYVHDSLYNRVEKDKITHSVNALNQLITDGKHRYTYDANGNLIHKDEVTYGYDALNRLTSITEGEHEYRYVYDAQNRRLSKQTWINNQLEETIHYLYQGQNEIGTSDASGEIKELRVLGTGLGAEIGAAVAIELSGSIYTPIHDHHGNVVCLLDQSGHTQSTYRYSAFGEEQIDSDKLQNPWRFSSKRFDPETGFLNFGRRYYEPTTGRWITADPQGYEAGPNLYAYLHNNPLVLIDLYGLLAMATIKMNEDRNGWLYQNMGSTYRFGNAFARCSARSFFHPINGVQRPVPTLLNAIERKDLTAAENYLNDPATMWGEVSGTVFGSSLAAGSIFRAGYAGLTRTGPYLMGTIGRWTARYFGRQMVRVPEIRPLGQPKQIVEQTYHYMTRDSATAYRRSTESTDKVLRQRFKPDPCAQGAHSVYRRSEITGKTEKYQTYWPQSNPRNPNPWERGIRFDSNYYPHEHYNKFYKQDIHTPHIHDPATPGIIRKPNFWEIP